MPILDTLSRFLRDRGGNFATILAISIIPVMLFAGAAVDYSNVMQARSKLQQAADTAALSGAIAKLEDADYEAEMDRFFRGNLEPMLNATVTWTDYDYDDDAGTAIVRARAEIPTHFLALAHFPVLEVAIEARAGAGTGDPGKQALDIVMCIDATGSMGPTIAGVRAQAFGFEKNLNNELAARDMKEFDVMRVRVHMFRDFAVDAVPMNDSGHMLLPARRADFEAFLGAQKAMGGGDAPESGLVCINQAMENDWLKSGDPVPSGSGKIGKAYPLIILWSDVDSLPADHANSLKRAGYPPATVMPRTFSGLTDKWNTSMKFDQDTKMLVTFVPNPKTTVWWKQVSAWDQFFWGGPVTSGTNKLVKRVVDAIEELQSGRMISLTK